MAGKTKDFTKTKKYRSIRQDLLDQLERNGTCGEHYTDLVHDYMDLWVEKKLLAEDIRVNYRKEHKTGDTEEQRKGLDRDVL